MPAALDNATVPAQIILTQPQKDFDAVCTGLYANRRYYLHGPYYTST